MYPLKMSAQFAAYAWYTEVRGRTNLAEALRFADQNWTNFVPSAHEGWGKLLMRLTNPKPHGKRCAKTPAMVSVI
jgi:hypothetical protein